MACKGQLASDSIDSGFSGPFDFFHVKEEEEEDEKMIDVRLFLGTYNDFSHVANEIEVKSAVSESHESSFGLIE